MNVTDEPARRILSIGTSRLLRLTELGSVILLENLHLERGETVDDGGERSVTVSERWLPVAKVDGPDRWHEAHMELGRLNELALQALRENRLRGRAGPA